MDSTQTGPADLADAPVDVKTKISALWAAVMFCYIYGDVFGLLKPGAIEAIVAGKAGPSGPMAQRVLVAMAVSMAIPSVMVFLSLVLRPPSLSLSPCTTRGCSMPSWEWLKRP